MHDPGGFSVLTDIHPGESHIRVDLSIVDPWATSVLFQTAVAPTKPFRHVTRCEFRELVNLPGRETGVGVV